MKIAEKLPSTEETPPSAQPAPPYLGRSVRIVGAIENVALKDTPHFRVARGELGEAAYNWRENPYNPEPLSRALANKGGDPRNQIRNVLTKQLKAREVNPTKRQVTDADAMTRHIKKVGLAMGADLVGIAASNAAFFYAAGGSYLNAQAEEDNSGAETPEELAKRYPFLITTPVHIDHNMIQAHRHFIGDHSYMLADQEQALMQVQLERYIHELGYSAHAGIAVPQPSAIAGGLGELGRNGMLITAKLGAQLVLGDVIATDLPLVADKPIDIGVSDFCNECRKCAVTCPTNSITHDDKVVWNGVEKYKINWQTCYRLRPYVAEYWETCLTCVTVCPYSKPQTWWHDLAVWVLHVTPVSLRRPVVKMLKLIDDKGWGVIPNKRVQWMGYDSGIRPGEKMCTIAGCTADHGSQGDPVELSKKPSNIGYYAPLKENTVRLLKRS
jgi:reductive dehalogenase